ncbi:MAG: hypothetical protein C5B59_20060 [Bacteroidetes bacterium]|nr:MAG: hypothetical protein C5B59_20060 [Bacteroidota bacterium]
MATKSLQIFIWGTTLLVVMNLIQAGTTELLDDESYYWMYSQHLDWGYYDHPPMIAWMIRAGYMLFPGTLGIRLFSVLAIGACFWILYVLQKPWNPIQMLILIFSAGIIHFGGFLAVPDVPLVFFSAVFLLLYRWFLREETWTNSLLLGVCMAALVYSKYQAILLVGICLATNIKLLKSKKFWTALLVCFVLMIPHIYWQWSHGLPSFQYFLNERYSSSTYHLWYTTDYIFGQLFFLGPLIGWLIFLAAFTQKPHGDHWILTLKSIVCGVLIFFLLSSFKGHVEPNWTAIIIIPSLLLLHYYLGHKPRMEKVLYRMFPISLALILLIRIGLVWNLAGDKIAINKELHSNKDWTSVIKMKARGFPVYFINSYQQASKYIYYQHGLATSYNGDGYRNNQYDFWRPETKWFQDSILVVSVERSHVSNDSICFPQGKLYFKMFLNPNVFVNYSFYLHMPKRKLLVPFLGEKLFAHKGTR